MELLKTSLYDFTYEPERGILSFLWTEKTADMGDDDFKAALLRYVGFVEGFQSPRLLIDVRRFRHRMTPALGTWREEVISPRYSAAGVRRLAFIVPEGVPAPPPEEEPPAGLSFVTGYFSAAPEADAWLAAG